MDLETSNVRNEKHFDSVNTCQINRVQKVTHNTGSEDIKCVSFTCSSTAELEFRSQGQIVWLMITVYRSYSILRRTWL